MKQLLFFLFVVCVSASNHPFTNEQHTHVRVGIIGAGIAGTSTAHFLRKSLGSDVRITVFEKREQAGGRVKYAKFAEEPSEPIELGGAVIHESNEYFNALVREANLTRCLEDGTAGIWSPNSLVLATDWGVYTTLKAVWRYMYGPFQVSKLADEAKNRFVGIYELLERSHFDTVEGLLKALQLDHYPKQTLREHLRENGVNEAYAREIVEAITRVNYGQTLDMQAFAGLVAVIGSNDGELYRVCEGNAEVIRRTLHNDQVILQLNTLVTAIRPADKTDGYVISFKDANGNSHEEQFDFVVIAVPLCCANIDLSKVQHGELNLIEYHTTHATFVKGLLNWSYFGRSSKLDEILTTEHEKSFSSISLKHQFEDGQGLFKIFSRAPLSDQLLAELFTKYQIVKHIPWRAYPRLTPIVDGKYPPFVISPRLYYPNAFEAAVSCIETEAAAGRNIASLIVNELRKQ